MNKAALGACLMAAVAGGCGAPTDPPAESPRPPTAIATPPGQKFVDPVEIADLQSICAAVENPGTPEDAALASIAQRLTGELLSAGARERIQELGRGRLVPWLQQLRRDAIATGLASCAFADRWEPWLQAYRTAAPQTLSTGAVAPTALPTATAAGSSGAVSFAAPAATESAAAQPPTAPATTTSLPSGPDQAGCPPPGVPPYPKEAKDAQVEATLIARCMVNTNGMLSCSMIKSHPLLDQTTRLFLALTRVPPFTARGTPVRVACNYTFRFKLQ